MSIRIAASGDYLTRTSSLPSATNFTICGWSYRHSAQNGTYRFIASMEDTAWPTDAASGAYIGFGSVDQHYITGPGGNNAFATNYGSDVWFFWAMTCAGTGASDFKGYSGRASDPSLQTAVTTGASFTPASILLGNDTYDEWLDCSLAAIKVWDAVLSNAELEAERLTYIAQRTANLHAFWPMNAPVLADNYTDYSGNARTLTPGGSLSVASDPPLPWGAASIAWVTA